MSASEDAVVSFCAVSGASTDVAQSFLASAKGDVETALSSYFETQAAGGGAARAAAGGAPTGGVTADDAAAIAAAMGVDEEPAPVTGVPRTLDGRPADPLPADWARRAGAAPAASGQRRTGLGTLGHSNDDDDEDDDGAMDEDDEDEVGPTDEPQNFFAGGERSGLDVQNPNARPGGGSNKLIRDLLKKAAENSDQRQADAKAGSSQPGFAFRGTGNTLGSEDEPSRVVPDPSAPPPRSTAPRMPGAFGVGAGEDDDEEARAPGREEVVTRVLTFWKDGFSIDDGPLLKYDEHKETLKALNDGRAPLDLLQVKFGQRVDVQIANRPQEMYRPPPPKPMQPFGGSGNRLGAPTPEVTAGSPKPAGDSGKKPPTGHGTPSPSQTLFEVNANEPVTTIQIRLGDGQRMVAKFNHTHTVGDVIAYINNAHPSNASRGYVLQTTFPNRELTDPSQTLKDANLLGTVVVQKFT